MFWGGRCSKGWLRWEGRAGREYPGGGLRFSTHRQRAGRDRTTSRGPEVGGDAPRDWQRAMERGCSPCGGRHFEVERRKKAFQERGFAHPAVPVQMFGDHLRVATTGGAKRPALVRIEMPRRQARAASTNACSWRGRLHRCWVFVVLGCCGLLPMRRTGSFHQF